MIYRRSLWETKIFNNSLSQRASFRNSLQRRANKIICKRWIFKRPSYGIVGQLGVNIGLHVRVKVQSGRMITWWWDRTCRGGVVDRPAVGEKINHNIIVIIGEQCSPVFDKTLGPKAFGWWWCEAIKFRTAAAMLKDSCPCPFWVEGVNGLRSCGANSHCGGIGVRRFEQCNMGCSA